MDRILLILVSVGFGIFLGRKQNRRPEAHFNYEVEVLPKTEGDKHAPQKNNKR